jgi:hypothetical protein
LIHKHIYLIEWLVPDVIGRLRRRNGPFQTGVRSGLAKWDIIDKVIAKVQFGAESLDLSSLLVDNRLLHFDLGSVLVHGPACTGEPQSSTVGFLALCAKLPSQAGYGRAWLRRQLSAVVGRLHERTRPVPRNI